MSKRNQGGYGRTQSSKAAERQRTERQRQLVYAILGVVAVVVLIAAIVFLTGGRGDDQTASAGDTPALTAVDGDRPLAAIAPAERNGYYDAYPPTVIDATKTYEAVINTSQGAMRLRLFADQAPLTVNNFVYLAQQGFYDATIFHRVLEDFMAQAGDPTGTGTGGPGYQFEDETDNGLTFDRRGLLAMANAGPSTNGSQFFITFVPTPWLDGNHTIFGELIEGDDVLASLRLRDPADRNAPADTIDSIEIFASD